MYIHNFISQSSRHCACVHVLLQNVVFKHSNSMSVISVSRCDTTAPARVMMRSRHSFRGVAIKCRRPSKLGHLFGGREFAAGSLCEFRCWSPRVWLRGCETRRSIDWLDSISPMVGADAVC